MNERKPEAPMGYRAIDLAQQERLNAVRLHNLGVEPAETKQESVGSPVEMPNPAKYFTKDFTKADIGKYLDECQMALDVAGKREELEELIAYRRGSPEATIEKTPPVVARMNQIIGTYKVLGRSTEASNVEDGGSNVFTPAQKELVRKFSETPVPVSGNKSGWRKLQSWFRS